MKKNWMRLLAPALLLLLGLALPASAATPAQDADAIIYLARMAFDPLAGPPAALHAPARLLQAAPDNQVYLLQFDGPVQESWKATVAAAGIELLHYIPDRAYAVRLRDAPLSVAGALPHVRWVGPYLPIYKIEPSLDALNGTETVSLAVRLFPGESANAVAPAILGWAGQIQERASSNLFGDTLKVFMPAGRITDLALLSAVAWIEPDLPMQLANDRARPIMQVNSAWATLTGAGVNLYGAGQIVDITDTGLDTGSAASLNLDFRDRFIKAYTWGRAGQWDDPNGHGTHVAGSVLGSGRNSGSNPLTHDYASSFAGIAPEASLIFQSLLTGGGGLQTPTDLKLLFGPAHTDGARIHSSSWGHPTGGVSPNYTYGGYDTASAYADEFMWLNPTSLLLFAAGNAGIDANADGVIDLDQILSPATAKNPLSVGATENNRPPSSGFGGYSNYPWGIGSWEARFPVNPIHDDYISNNIAGMAAFSSRGPTDDGRIKPEVVAPGTDIISARSAAAGAGVGWGIHDNYYVYNGGTSMATPLTAGAATLVRQFYTSAQRLSNPSAALMKATLISGAQNITPGQYGAGAAREIPATLPNNVEGFGRVDLMNALALNPNQRLVYWDAAGGLATGSVVSYTVYITDTAPAGTRLAVTLCWTDYPAAPGAAKTLVNDLDLEVIAPDGSHLLGNGKPYWDRANNTEQVVVAAPTAGAYLILVRGATVPQGPQPYALVATAPYMTTSPNMSRRVWLPLILRQYGGTPPTLTPTATPAQSPTATATPTRTPTVTPTPTPAPLAGFWQNSDGAIEFYVTADQAHVTDFAVYINVPDCGNYRIVHSQPEPIAARAFSFLGDFFASATFLSSMTSAGTTGLYNYYIAGCGYVTGGPWDFGAVWRGAALAPADAPTVAANNAGRFTVSRTSR